MDPRSVTLTGRLVRLEPLALEHAPALLAASADESIWRYLPRSMPTSLDDVRAWIADALAAQRESRELPFAIVELASGRAVGSTRYMDIRPAHRGLEIGWTWLGRSVQRTGVNTESKLLVLTHAFEALGALRVQLKTDGRNTVSQRAIERLGAVREGVLRRHMIMWDGAVRDTVMYSILADEWPAAKARLAALREDRSRAS